MGGSVPSTSSTVTPTTTTLTGTATTEAPPSTASISLSPDNGPVGKTVKVTGTGFAASSTVTITFSGVTQTTSPSTITTNTTGGFTATFKVPKSTAGPHTVTATDASADSASKTFKVNSSISLSSSSGIVGKTSKVTGTGFAASSTVTITFDGIAQTTSPSTITTDATGSFTATFKIPKSTAGTHTVTATDASGDFASKTFKVISSTSLSPYTGHVGTTETVTGTGFAASSTVTITFGGVTQTTSPATITTDTTGSFSASFTVPPSTAGYHTITSKDASGNSDDKRFKVTPSISLVPASGPAGTPVTVSGKGFAASSTVKITFDGITQTTLPGTITTNTAGSFTATFTAPPSTTGSHTVKATDASSHSASTTFTTS